MIKVTHKPTGKSHIFPDDYLPRIALQVTGGGYTEKQTRDAMILMDKVKDKGKATTKNAIVEVVE